MTIEIAQGCNCAPKSTRKLDSFENLYLISELRPIEIHQCLTCGLIWSRNYPVDSDTLARINEKLSVTFEVPLARSIQKIEAIRDGLGLKIENLKLIDFGGGTGRTAKALTNIGLSTRSYDPYSSIDPTVEEQYFSQNLQTSIEGGANAISMFHVLEHLVNPVTTLKWIRELVSETDFTLIIEVPVLDAEQWFSLDPTPFWSPFHVTHFTINSLKRILRQSSWEITSEYCFPDYNGFLVSCKPVSTLDKHHPVESNSQDNSDLKLADIYLTERSFYRARLGSRISNLLASVDDIVFWGAGIGLDMFMRDFGELIGDRPYSIIDIAPERQGLNQWGHVLSPSTLVIQKSSKVGVIPTAYARARAIEQSAEKLFGASGVVLKYPLIRAY